MYMKHSTFAPKKLSRPVFPPTPPLLNDMESLSLLTPTEYAAYLAAANDAMTQHTLAQEQASMRTPFADPQDKAAKDEFLAEQAAINESNLPTSTKPKRTGNKVKA